MLDPLYIANIADEAEEVSARLHDEIINDMVRRMTARLGRGEEAYLTATDRQQIKILQEAGYLLNDIKKDVTRAIKAQRKEVKKAYEDAGLKQTAYDRRIYQQVGIKTDLTQSPTYLRILQAAYERSMQGFENFTGTTLTREVYTQFINSCNDAYMQVTTGAKGWTQAYMEAVDKLASNGVEVIYPSGHRDTIETATARAIRTGVAQACSKVTATRAAENGVHLFLTSAHQGARPTHEPWQGKVFWVDWNELSRRINITENINYSEATDEEKTKYKEFCRSTDIGTVTGLEGANCRHSYGPFFEGMKNPYEGMKFNKDQYAIDQRQRLLERRIRKTKRAIAAYDTALKNTTNEEALNRITKSRKAKLNTLTRQVSEYYDYCDKFKLKPQESRLHIG